MSRPQFGEFASAFSAKTVYDMTATFQRDAGGSKRADDSGAADPKTSVVEPPRSDAFGFRADMARKILSMVADRLSGPFANQQYSAVTAACAEARLPCIADEAVYFQEGHDITFQEVHFRDLARTGWPCPKTCSLPYA